MNVYGAIAEIQANPASVSAYRYLARYYYKLGMKNEGDALTELIRIRLDGSNSSNPGEEQSDDDTKND